LPPSTTPSFSPVINGPSPRSVKNSRQLTKSSLVGEEVGNSFDDFQNDVVKIGFINVYHGTKLNGLGAQYERADGSTYQVDHVGSDHGTTDTFYVFPSEVIVGLEGYTTDDNEIGSITFFVKESVNGHFNIYGPYGRSGTNYFSIDGQIVGLFGRVRDDDSLTAFGAYYLPLVERGPRYGGEGGELWDDPVYSFNMAMVNIKEITVSHGKSVDSIQVNYEILGGGVYEADKHGGDGGSPTTIHFDPGEVLVEMFGNQSDIFMNQIGFVTRKPDGSKGTHGPFGNAGSKDIAIGALGNIIGFYGSAGGVLDSIGVYFSFCP
jgi:hypothetical protein